MEQSNLKEKKLKLRKKLLVIKDIILVMLAIFFIIIGFMYGIDNGKAAGDSFRNVRYGMFSFSLIISSTLLIISVYNGKKNK
jgi:TRAP-type C4-dicarboxylate transport system permease small subunit